MIDAATHASSTSPRAGSAEQKLRRAANELVGSVFYGTLLRRMRSSVLTGPYGHGGNAEKMFQGQLDQIFAERAGAARSTRLTDAIIDRYGKKANQMAGYLERANADSATANTSVDERA